MLFVVLILEYIKVINFTNIFILMFILYVSKLNVLNYYPCLLPIFSRLENKSTIVCSITITYGQ